MTTKRFDPSLYSQFDAIGKQFATASLVSAGFTVRNNTKKMDVDLIVSKMGVDLFFVECEIKKYIKKGKFAYDTLHILSRKRKYCGLELPTLFMLFAEDGSKFLAVWSEFILASPLKEVSNKYVSKGESFFDVPMSSVDDSIEKALERLNSTEFGLNKK